MGFFGINGRVNPDIMHLIVAFHYIEGVSLKYHACKSIFPVFSNLGYVPLAKFICTVPSKKVFPVFRVT